jgi:hypothetical protein
MNDAELREFARKRLKKQAEYKNYLWVWLGVSVLCTAVWFLTGSVGGFWPGWVIFGMGIGALFGGIDAYRTNDPRMISDEDVEREVNRIKGTTKN